jgi:hypothetical protein
MKPSTAPSAVHGARRSSPPGISMSLPITRPVLLAGRVAEEVVFGEPTISAKDDLARATALADKNGQGLWHAPDRRPSQHREVPDRSHSERGRSDSGRG